ncbi:MAG TPA: hypothetical protein VJ719_06280 [Chthoniobacterales bacterium]|nr:hypothetical protein [Chthoniobacterales bacterium]
MKPRPTFVLIISAFQLLSFSAFSQGPLTPPAFPAPDPALNNLGQPIPSMKTLTQVEPRRPISSAPFTISTPGSYYLTQNLAVANGDAITISTDDVTLDLNGFTISSTANPAGGTAIFITSGRANITISHGHVKGQVVFSGGNFSGNGFANGIHFTGTSPRNVRVMDVSISGCGSLGINLGVTDSSLVYRSVVRTVGDRGITAAVVDSCTAQETGATAIEAETASNCRGESKGDTGVVAVTASNCVGRSESSTGVDASQANNCRGSSNSGTGLTASFATNSSAVSQTGVGLSATTAHNCLGTSVSGPAGMNIVGTASFCRGSRANGTAINAHIAIGCTVSFGTINAPGGKFLGTP